MKPTPMVGMALSVVLLAACTGTDTTRAAPSTTSATTPSASSSPQDTSTLSSISSKGAQKAAPDCAPHQLGAPKGQFADVHGWIAYRCGSRIIAVNPEHPNHPLSLGPSYRADPIGWSQDGTRLLLRGPNPAFSGYAAGGCGWDFSVLDVGGTTTQLGLCARYDGVSWISFSPDGSMIAFAVSGPFSGGGVYVLDADGGAPRLLAKDKVGEPFPEPAAWSPDGRKIAFIDFTEDDSTYGHHSYGVSIVNADGTGLRELVHLPTWRDPNVGVAGSITWSPDGSRLALSMTRWYRLPSRIYVVGGDGSGLKQLTNDGRSNWPAWSPDGSRIAFVRGHRLFTMAPDGSDVQRVEGVDPDGSIAWNPVA